MIYYYLSDGSIHLNEPRVQNSGLMQGVFIKRQKIPKQINSAGDYYTWEDLNLGKKHTMIEIALISTTCFIPHIGININLYQRVFRITDCDAFTKEYYAYMGARLNPAEAPPADNFDSHKKLKDLKISPPDTKEYNEYNEVKLGGGHPNGGLEKYIENDRKVR